MNASPSLRQRVRPVTVAALVAAIVVVVMAGAWARWTRDGPGVAIASGPLSSSPTAPAPGPGSSAIAATAIDPTVVLRVGIRPDVSVGRIPRLTVYRDGTVLRADDASGRVTRLTSAGLAQLLEPATDSHLFSSSGDIRPDSSWAAGYVSYAIELRNGDAMVHRSTTNVLLTPATKLESQRLITLAEHLDDLETWLPADAWAIAPAAATPYVASQFIVKVTLFKQPGVDYPPQALDRADVVWPLVGSLEGFGVIVPSPPLGPGTSSRCGVVTLADATAVLRALTTAPIVSIADRQEAELGWAPDIGHVSVSLIPLLPDDPPTCAADLGWP